MAQILNQDDRARLERMDERTQYMTKSLDSHVEEDNRRFERIFNYVKDRFDGLEEKIDTLWDEKNQRSGAIRASQLITGGAWAIAAVVASWFIGGKP